MTISAPSLPDTRIRLVEVDRLLAAAQRVGLDRHALLVAAGAAEEDEAIRTGRTDGMTPATHAALYRETMLRIEARATSASGRAPVTSDDYALMWQSAITCRTLAAVITRIQAFSRLLDGRMGAISLDVQDEIARFALDPMRGRRSAASFVSEMVGMSMFVRMLSWLIGEEIAIAEIVFDYPARYAGLLDLDLHDRPVRLAGKATYVEFATAYLDRPVIRTAEELDALLPLSWVSVAAQPRAGAHTRRVHHLIDEAIAAGAAMPDMTALCARFRCSAASLRRWLEREGTSLRHIKQQRRHDWAVELLRRSGSSVAQVAEQLGYSDDTAFRRAFRHWAGKSPVVYQTAPRAAQPVAYGRGGASDHARAPRSRRRRGRTVSRTMISG